MEGVAESQERGRGEEARPACRDVLRLNRPANPQRMEAAEHGLSVQVSPPDGGSTSGLVPSATRTVPSGTSDVSST